jgi:hypothetical protein
MNKFKFKCDECDDKTFKTQRGLNLHTAKVHPYVPPPPPKKETETAPNEYEEHTLLDGRSFRLGDVVWLGKKAVIIKITKTEGSNDVVVNVRLTKMWYSREEIS